MKRYSNRYIQNPPIGGFPRGGFNRRTSPLAAANSYAASAGRPGGSRATSAAGPPRMRPPRFHAQTMSQSRRSNARCLPVPPQVEAAGKWRPFAGRALASGSDLAFGRKSWKAGNRSPASCVKLSAGPRSERASDGRSIQTDAEPEDVSGSVSEARAAILRLGQRGFLAVPALGLSAHRRRVSGAGAGRIKALGTRRPIARRRRRAIAVRRRRGQADKKGRVSLRSHFLGSFKGEYILRHTH